MGADINAADNNGFLPLHCAVRQFNAASVAMLLAAGANVEAVDNSHQTPMQCSAGNRSLQCLLVAARVQHCPVSLNQEEFDVARQQIAAAARRIDAERLQLKRDRRALVAKRTLPMLLALQNLRFPAYVTLMILDESLGGLRDITTMHFKWEVITAVKHFHERAAAAAAASAQSK